MQISDLIDGKFQHSKVLLSDVPPAMYWSYGKQHNFVIYHALPCVITLKGIGTLRTGISSTKQCNGQAPLIS